MTICDNRNYYILDYFWKYAREGEKNTQLHIMGINCVIIIIEKVINNPIIILMTKCEFFL